MCKMSSDKKEDAKKEDGKKEPNADVKEMHRLAKANKDRLAASKEQTRTFVSDHNAKIKKQMMEISAKARQMRLDAENSGNVNKAFFEARRKLLEKRADLKMGMK